MRILNSWIAFACASLAMTACLPKDASKEGGSQTSAAIGALDYEDVESYIKTNNMTDGSAMTQIINSIGLLSNGCTAWLLTPKHLITNHHCIVNDFKVVKEDHPYDAYDQSVCTNMTIHFDKQAAKSPTGYRRPPSTEFHCARVVLANMAHDTAIIELKEAVPPELVPLRLAKAFVPNGQEIVLIGQPGAGNKKISYHNSVSGTNPPQYTPCHARPSVYMTGSDGSDDPHVYERPKNPNSFVHDCDTIGGNSGSPVLDASTLEVVGLHWNGWSICKWPHFDANGKLDDFNEQNGHGNETADGRAANAEADKVRYKEGNTAIDIMKLREFVSAMPVGTDVGQIPAEVKAAFE